MGNLALHASPVLLILVLFTDVLISLDLRIEDSLELGCKQDQAVLELSEIFESCPCALVAREVHLVELVRQRLVEGH